LTQKDWNASCSSATIRTSKETSPLVFDLALPSPSVRPQSSSTLGAGSYSWVYELCTRSPSRCQPGDTLFRPNSIGGPRSVGQRYLFVYEPRYLRTGESDPLCSAWSGSFMEGGAYSAYGRRVAK
jgi:hypothetical protein